MKALPPADLALGSRAPALLCALSALLMVSCDRISLSGGSIRNASVLQPAFGVGGVVTIDPSLGDDEVFDIAVDSTHIYLVGSDASLDPVFQGDVQWRIVKVARSNGAIAWTVTVNPTPDYDTPNSVAIDSTHLYVAGGAGGSWRIEKRLLSTGALDASFGVGGAVTTDISAGYDIALDVAVNAPHLYVIGVDETPGTLNWQWRMERRALSDGALQYAVTSDPSASDDIPQAVAVDNAQGVYVAGQYQAGAGDIGRRIEKRNKGTGALVTQFGGTGILSSNPSSGLDLWKDVAFANGRLFVAGADSAAGNERILLEVYDPDTGTPKETPVGLNPSANRDFAVSFVHDFTSGKNFILGGDGQLGSSNGQWFLWKVDDSGNGDSTFSSGGPAPGYFVTNPSSHHDYATKASADNGDLFVIGRDAQGSNDTGRWRVHKYLANP